MDKNALIGLATALFVLLFLFWGKKAETTAESTSQNTDKQLFIAHYGSPLIDGKGDDMAWQDAEWLPLDQVWIGQAPTATDFAGRYKILWDENNLYVLAEITDDTLVDIHPDGLLKYWDDDCLEIFVDEDASGGNHQYNYNAFAYHIALDDKVVDIRPDSAFAYFNEHCITRRITAGKTSTWEVAVNIFNGNKYVDGGENIPKMLKPGKQMGFALAYCDNDHSAERENFIGSVRVDGADKNRGWIDAGIFGVLQLR
ncbi:MAG: CBM9 family sugar-binding protein [Phycisphaerae bacterium]|nr:CBM9 family sugar-binding protein [Saprospiraceae bacterium]